MSRTLVIAEPGCTHEGSREQMLRLLETAKQCGADVWKPQWVSDPERMCERRHITADHPKRAYYLRAYSWLTFPVEWHAEFSARCHELGMQYAVTCFLPQDVATVAPFVDYLKVSSFEAFDAELLYALNAPLAAGKRIIISSGMAKRGSWYELQRQGVPARKIRGVLWLHCVSAYPAPLGAMNLRCITASDSESPNPSDGYDGLSDHSRNLLTGAVAVGAGATVIETHYRLDDCDATNPDYAVAFTPAEFTQYIQNIRDAELMLGDGVKRVQPCEEWALPYRVMG